MLPLLLHSSRKGQYSGKVLNTERSKLIGAWQFDDPIGSKIAENTVDTQYPLTEILFNGDFETSGAGGADIWANWLETVSDGALADEGTIVPGGSHAAKITSGPTSSTWVQQNYSGNPAYMKVKPGWTLTITMWARGDGINSGRYALYNTTGSAWIRTLLTVGVTAAAYTQVTFSHVVPAGCYEVALYLAGPAANGGIAYFDDVSMTATFTLEAWLQLGIATVTFGEIGIGDGKTSALFNGASSGLILGNKAYNSAFDGDVGSVVAWGKVDGAARWTDASSMRYLWHPKSRTDPTVYMIIGRHTDNHTVFWRRRIAASIYEQKYVFAPTGPTTWFCMGFRWDITSTPKNFAGFIYAPGHTAFTKVFDDASSPGYGDQAWNKSTYPVDDANTLLAAGAANGQLWIGNQAHCYQWAGVALTDAQFQLIMVP